MEVKNKKESGKFQILGNFPLSFFDEGSDIIAV